MNKILFITPLDKKNFNKITSKFKSTNFIFKNPKKSKDILFIKEKYKKFNFLISYANGLIIPKKIISHFNFLNIINFHPATPNYRGRDTQHFAAYRKEKIFGGTLHYLTNKIDSGKIIDVKFFKIKINSSHYEYQKKALKALNFLLKKNLKKILENKQFKKNTFNWSGKIYKRSDFLKMLKISNTITKKDFDHVYKSFFTYNRLSLYTKLYKKKFFITDKEKNN